MRRALGPVSEIMRRVVYEIWILNQNKSSVHNLIKILVLVNIESLEQMCVLQVVLTRLSC